MSRYITYAEIFDGKVPEDFGVAVVKGSSLTIPGQGQDLAQIISSIVKLPPLDERTFDVGSGEEPDTRVLAVSTELDSLYKAEQRNVAESASERQKTRKERKDREATEADENEEPSDEAEKAE